MCTEIYIWLQFYTLDKTTYKRLFQAKEIGLYGPNIVWLLPIWFSSTWYQSATECSPQDILDVIDHSAIYTGFSSSSPDPKQKGISGYSLQEFEEEFLRRANFTELKGSSRGPAAYDCVWAAALALNATQNLMDQQGKPWTVWNLRSLLMVTVMYDCR